MCNQLRYCNFGSAFEEQVWAVNIHIFNPQCPVTQRDSFLYSYAFCWRFKAISLASYSGKTIICGRPWNDVLSHTLRTSLYSQLLKKQNLVSNVKLFQWRCSSLVQWISYSSLNPYLVSKIVLVKQYHWLLLSIQLVILCNNVWLCSCIIQA